MAVYYFLIKINNVSLCVCIDVQELKNIKM